MVVYWISMGCQLKKTFNDDIYEMNDWCRNGFNKGSNWV